ncbi:YolD-like family protein [Bacillus sp. 7884-1]|uniref:YolD-like family protein n=1 Tax=Bacillus sp. 7884-1 TaxID=2021693 RepID=UPI00211BDDB6|nr:YolD-like family protein [Bacillus sp. 7884-1]
MIELAIRDRGVKKWQGAFFMPEQVKMQRELWRDTQRFAKPIIDEYQLEEFDQCICYAMEYNLSIKLTVWADGFTEDVTGSIQFVDPITHQLRVEVRAGEFERIGFDSVVGVKVLD